MSTRRHLTERSLLIFYVSAALIVASCQKKEAAAPAATPPGSVKTTTVAAPSANLSRANIHEIINTRGVEGATQARIGNSRGPDGNVQTEATSFKPSDPIYLTMWIPDAPRGLQTRAEWFDAGGKLLRQDLIDPSGSKVVTFEWTGKPLKPGRYHVTGYWGGNVAAEKDFTVEGRPAKAPAKPTAKKKSK